MSQNLTELLGHGRAQDRAGRGHKIRRHIKRELPRLRAKIEAATTPEERARWEALVKRKLDILRKVDAAAKRTGDTWRDPRSQWRDNGR